MDNRLTQCSDNSIVKSGDDSTRGTVPRRTKARECYYSSPGALEPISQGYGRHVAQLWRYNGNFDYTSNLNNGLHRTDYYSQREIFNEQRYEQGKTSVWEYTRTIEFYDGSIKGSGWSSSKKDARNRCDAQLYYQLEEILKKRQEHLSGKRSTKSTVVETRNKVVMNVLNKNSKESNQNDITHSIFGRPQCQMDAEQSDGVKQDLGGVTEQESSQASNTIITRDEGESVSVNTENLSLETYASSEKIFSFPDVTNRWMPLKTIEITTSMKMGDRIKTYYYPESFYEETPCAPNINPYEIYIYSIPKLIEFRVIAHGHPYMTGLIIISVKCDSYQADSMQATVMSALSRPHILLDLASRNQGVLKIPFRYHRAMLRNVKNDNNSKGIRPGKAGSVYVDCLSPLRTGKEGATNLYLSVFYRFVDCSFAGMSYRVPKLEARTQMDIADDVLEFAYQASGLKTMLRKYEDMSLQIGRGENNDKPINYDSQIFVPRPRMNFATGKGLSDAQPLRNNPLSLTSHKWIKQYKDEPRTTLEIARIWGLRDKFVWKTGDKVGTELWAARIDPTSRSYTSGYTGTPTPVEYICGFYNFWAGGTEWKFYFATNGLIKGSVMISIEFGRPVEVGADMCSKASTYTKVFDLGDQRDVKVTAPYIYDTILRRSTSCAYNPNFSKDAADTPTSQTKYNATGIRAESKAVIRVTVLNELRASQTTTQEIDVLVFLRAAPNFVVHSVKQMSYVPTRESTGVDPFIDSFPRDNYLVADDVRRKRNTSSDELPTEQTGIVKLLKEIQPRGAITPQRIQEISHKNLPSQVSNSWNEYSAETLDHISQRVGGIVQMDQGDKDAPDDTLDFKAGRVNLPVMTSDFQVNIKDILRRPVLLIHRQRVNSFLEKGEQFFLPVMPPSREFNYHPNQNKAIFSELVGQTPQAALMNCFRCWNGGSRYTIFLHKAVEQNTSGKNSEPLYITYIPHTGTRIIGNQIIGNGNSKRPVMACGVSTEVLLPSVNPSAVVEVPYDTENNWTLTFEEDTQRNYAWRDKGDTNAGHLVLTCDEPIDVSIWWSAADDFQIANFYGIPECRNRDAEYQWSDAHGRVQMDNGDMTSDQSIPPDFHLVEGRTLSSTLSKMKEEVMRLSDPKILAKAALGSIPMVGPAVVLAPTVVSLEKLAGDSSQAVAKLTRTLGTIDTAADALTNVSSQLAPLISTINSFVTTTIPSESVFKIWSERLVDFITDLTVAWYRKSWIDVGIACIKILAKVLLVQVSTISHYVAVFAEAVSGFGGRARVQAPSDLSTVVGAIAGIVGLALGVKICQENYSSYANSLSRAIFQTSGISYINQVIRFVQTIFDILRDMIMEALGYKSPEAVALKLLSGKDLLLKSFIASAQSVINEANSTMVLHPRFRTKFWYTVTQAYQIQQVLTMIPTNVVSPQLSRLCGDVIRVGNERMMDLSCSPVRYEPFVVCIEGGHGIGKSHLTEKVVAHLLRAVGFDRASSGWTYTRAPGSKFWSGYRDQPAIIYDDWLNLNDTQLMSQQISELYQLKSTSTFIPEMAHLEEKRIKANPMLVVLLTNEAYPTGMSNVAHHPRAVFRRRDVVLRATVKTEFVNINPRDLSAEDSEHVAHLEFSKYQNSCNQNSRGDTKRSFDQTMQWLAQTFKRYHAQEEKNVRTRVDMLREQMQIDAATTFDFEDPFSLLYKSIDFISGSEELSTNAWLPSEQLEEAVLEIVMNIQQRKNTPVQIVVPPPPDDIFVQFDCCPASWSELGAWFARGAVMTPDVAHVIAKWSAEGLSTMVSSITSWTCHMFIGECCVCNEEKELAYACIDSNNLHRICAVCWGNIQRLSPSITCPVCRSSNVGVVFQKEDGMLAAVLYWLSEITNDFLLPAINMLCRALSKFSYRAISKLRFIGELVLGVCAPLGLNSRGAAYSLGQIISAEVINPSESYYDAIGELSETVTNSPGESLIHLLGTPVSSYQWHIQNSHNIPQSQADDEWGDGPEPRDLAATRMAQTNNNILGECHLNEVGFQASREIKNTLLPRCYHSRLTTHVDTIIYRDSQIHGPAWQVPMELNGRLESILILDNPCQHNCVWQNEEIHRTFCNLYIARHRAVIQQAQIQYVSALQTNPIEFLKRLPRFARPNWAVQQVLPVDLNESNWWTYLSDTWSAYRDMLVVTGVIAGTMGAVYFTYTHITSFLLGAGTTEDRLDHIQSVRNGGTCSPSNIPIVSHVSGAMSQSDPNYNPEHARFIQRAQREVRPLRVARIQGDNLGDVVESYICKNYVRIIVLNPENNKTRYLTAIGLFNHYAAIPRHYVKVLEDAKKTGKIIWLSQAAVEWSGSKYTRQEYTYDTSDFIQSDISDIAYFKVPVSFRMFKDIRKFVVTQKDLNNYVSSEGKILLAPTRENQIPQVVPLEIQGYQHSAIFQNFDDSEFEAFHILRYTFSKQGACGSLICVENSQRPIIAMHCAGQGDGIYGVGWGVLLTQESIREMLPHIDTVVTQCEEREFMSMETAKFIFDDASQVDYLGTVPPALQPHIPQKSKIEKSLLHGKFGFKSFTEPTILSPQDPRYRGGMKTPLYCGARKHGVKTKDFISSQVRRAKEALWTRWISGMRPIVVEPRKLTPKEAILGFVGNKYYEALSLNTSSGYPWNIGSQTTKEHWIKVNWDQRECDIHPELQAELDRKEKMRKEGIVPCTIFVDTLKDERKKSEKVLKEGATRVFCASPVDYTIALRQSLLHFCAAYMKNRHTQMHAVGIDVHAEEWARLWSRLTKHGKKFIGLDYSNFGPAFNALVASAASDLMRDWTLKYVAGVNARELDALNWECDASVHLCGNTVYQQHCGSPSGASITVIKNSLVNLLYILIAWEALCAGVVRDYAIDIWNEFADNVEVCVYGDDLIMTVSEIYLSTFNARTVRDWFADFGIVSTDASKESSEGEMQEWLPADKITFLKRGWKRHPTRPYQYLAPLDMVSINDITQWVWRSADRRQATRVNCESALLECHSQGPEVYEALRLKINLGLEKLKISPITMNWYDVDNKYFEHPVEVGATELWG